MNHTATPKLDALTTAGPDALVYNLDWDRTLTVPKENRVSMTTWDVFRSCMTPENRKRHSRLYAHYGPLEKAGELTMRQSRDWQIRAQRLLIGVPLPKIEDVARQEIQLRAGVSDLLEACSAYDVPTHVKSTGGAVIIRAVCAREGLKPTKISSNEFYADNNGVITGFRQPVVHSLNKNLFALDDSVPTGQRRFFAVNIGDNLHDVTMTDRHTQAARHAGALSLNIRLDGSRDTHIQKYGPNSWTAFEQESFAHDVDMILLEEDVAAITGLTHQLCASAAA